MSIYRLLEIYLSESIALAAINTFKGGALFKRTVAPIIVTHVDEALEFTFAMTHRKVHYTAQHRTARSNKVNLEITCFENALRLLESIFQILNQS